MSFLQPKANQLFYQVLINIKYLLFQKKMKHIKTEKLNGIIYKLSQQAIRNHNKKMLNNYYIFQPSAPLVNFLQQKIPKLSTIYTLQGLVNILKKIIKDELMYDQQNPSIIFCSPLLEKSFNMKAFHINELPELVIKQLVCLSESLVKKYQIDIKKITQIEESYKYQENKSEERKEKSQIQETFKTTSIFKISDKLKNVLCQNSNRTVFIYYEIISMLSKYLLSKKEIFFDDRNVKIAMIAYDPLAHVFQVNAFHKSQMHALLRKQLTIVQINPKIIFLIKK